MNGTATIVISIVGAAVGITGVLGLMLRILATNIAREFNSTNKRIDDLKADTNSRIDDLKADMTGRIDETNRRIESLTSEMHQGFEQVNRELAENRERMAKLEGSLDGFLAGRRDRDAA